MNIVGYNRNRVMSKWLRINILSILLLALTFNGLAQNVTPQTDTLIVREVTKNTSLKEQRKNGSGNGSTYQAVKRVRNGRPDLTRRAGARPPVIVRPSGSGIPKGAGKPGGVGRKGGK